MPPHEPVAVRSPYYQLPRTPGGGRAVAPSRPFSDTGPVRSVAQPHPAGAHRLTIACPAAALPALAARLATRGVGDLHVVVRLAGSPGTDIAPVVAKLAEARIAALRTGRVDVGPDALPGWFELGKACLAHGVPLHWSGSLPEDASAHWTHLPPPADQPGSRQRWYYGELGWRRGPGFAQVVDSRGDVIRQRRIQLRGLTPLFGEMLDHPAPVDAVPAAILDRLRGAGLVAVFANQVSWLPYRLRRWPSNTLST